MRLRIDRFTFALAVCIVVGASCSGGGACGGCTTFTLIPGGFPAAKRAPNAAQLRVTQTALATVAANPAAVLGGLVGGGGANGVIQFDVPSSCSGSTQICCDGNGNPVQPCGPLDIDLNQHAGDPTVLTLAPKQNQSELDLTINTRIKSAMDLPVVIPAVGACTIAIDSTKGNPPYFTITSKIQFLQDATAGTTRVNATGTAVNFDINSISINGGFGCGVANFFKAVAKGFLQTALQNQVQNAINGQTCKKCSNNDVATCGSPFATACTNGVCQEGNQCLQELGLDGRARGTALFGGFSPGTTGAIDIYEVAGGYATTDSNGIALGLLGGMEPGGAPRDMCGPSASEPAQPAVPISTYFQGNTDPDTGSAFDVGIGVHSSQLDRFAYAGYQGGLLCLTIGHSTVAQLTTDTVGLISRSLTHLVETATPMAVGLRPQSPPTIVLGKNTFMSDGMGHTTLVDPLLDIHFTQMEIDFFAAVDDQFIRVFTVVADVHLPVGLQTAAMGEIVPVIGSPMDAFTNLSVKNSQAVTESPDQLASLFPSILGLVLPQLSNGIAPIKLPKLGGLALNVTAITAVDNNQFLAIYANLALGLAAQRTVHTTANVIATSEPADAILRDARRWRDAEPPSVTLELGGDASDLEFSYRLDDGAWSAWDPNPRPKLAPRTFWLPGLHRVEARARQIGHPETIDERPVVLELPIGTSVPMASDDKKGKPEPFHGQPGTSGCGCDGGGGAGGAWPIALAFVLMMLPLRRIRRAARRIPGAAWLAALACLPGCNCNNNPCGSAKCIAGDVPAALGRWTSIAGDDKRVLVATYDQLNGDLVVVDATDPSKQSNTAVDGVPNVPPTHDPSSYRGGVAEPGPNVGAWTSIVLAGHAARVAYEDRDNKNLKYAFEDSGGKWHSYVVDPGGEGVEVGPYASLAIDGSGNPAIAYLAIGSDDGMGHRVTTLQLARATKNAPQAPADWHLGLAIDAAPGTCAGLCGAQTCIAPASATDTFACVAPTSDCTASCSSSQACYMGTCRTAVAAPTVEDIPTGTGLFASLVVQPGGQLAVVYYDRTKRALVIAAETAPGTSQFMTTILDGNVTDADRGMWSKAVVAADGTIHIAYQDAIGDQLLYTTWNPSTGPGTPEVADDGTRTGDRTHNVGAGAAIYLDGNGSPVIAYQDGLVADVYVATRGAPTWSTQDLSPGPLLDGFSIAATTAHGGTPYLAWDTRDPSQDPPYVLTVKKP
jgi:hypothetical protein